jgi:uncharacterized membrane protein
MRLTRAGIVLGLGVGGFFDGIVLHQILGWHHMVCTTLHCKPLSVAQLEQQNTLDGYFHLACWVLTLIGLIMLSGVARRHAGVWSGKALAGAMLMGCGLFNFVEGIIDHQILGIHHVLPDHPHQLLFDIMFLASGVVLFLIGRVLRSPQAAAGSAILSSRDGA